jgi:hypothetical protein
MGLTTNGREENGEYTEEKIWAVAHCDQMEFNLVMWRIGKGKGSRLLEKDD